MNKKKLSQNKLHELTGLSPAAINKIYYNTSRRIDLDTLEKLVDFFDCEVEDILEKT